MSPQCNLKGRIEKPEEQIMCEGEISIYEDPGMWLCQKHLLLLKNIEQKNSDLNKTPNK